MFWWKNSKTANQQGVFCLFGAKLLQLVGHFVRVPFVYYGGVGYLKREEFTPLGTTGHESSKALKVPRFMVNITDITTFLYACNTSLPLLEDINKI